MLAGFTGLVSLMIQTKSAHHKVILITSAFAAVLGCSIIAVTWIWYYYYDEVESVVLFLNFALIVISMSALYSDWTLGVMAGNLLGVPSGDIAVLFWSYFALKRFTMLSL